MRVLLLSASIVHAHMHACACACKRTAFVSQWAILHAELSRIVLLGSTLRTQLGWGLLMPAACLAPIAAGTGVGVTISPSKERTLAIHPSYTHPIPILYPSYTHPHLSTLLSTPQHPSAPLYTPLHPSTPLCTPSALLCTPSPLYPLYPLYPFVPLCTPLYPSLQEVTLQISLLTTSALLALSYASHLTTVPLWAAQQACNQIATTK